MTARPAAPSSPQTASGQSLGAMPCSQILVDVAGRFCNVLNVAAVVGQDTQSAVTPMRGGASELSGRVGCEARFQAMYIIKDGFGGEIEFSSEHTAVRHAIKVAEKIGGETSEFYHTCLGGQVRQISAMFPHRAEEIKAADTSWRLYFGRF